MSNIHPVPFKIKGMELTICGHLWENLFFNRGRAERDSFEDIGVENVYSGVDTIRDEFNGFLDETLDLSCLIFHDYDAILRWFFHFGDNDSPFFAMRAVEFGELPKWVVL